MRNLLLELTYRGDQFSGWQIQRNTVTVQGVLKETLERICGKSISIKGASRTDTGVHAIQQFAVVKGEITHTPDTLMKALNGNLPESIRILSIREVDNNFDPLKSAKAKVYIYFLWKGTTMPPLLKGMVFHLKHRVDERIMMRCARLITGEKDFASFMNKGGSAKTTVRKVFFSEWLSTEKFLAYSICANGFLKQMVRILVGTMIDVGRGKISEDAFRNLFEKQSRNKAGKTAPPYGLYLTKIFYKGSPNWWWRKERKELIEFMKKLEHFLLPIP